MDPKLVTFALLAFGVSIGCLAKELDSNHFIHYDLKRFETHEIEAHVAHGIEVQKVFEWRDRTNYSMYISYNTKDDWKQAVIQNGRALSVVRNQQGEIKKCGVDRETVLWPSEVIQEFYDHIANQRLVYRGKMRMYDGVYRDWYMYKSTSVPQRVVAYWLDDNEQLVALQLFDVRLQTAVEYRVINVETDVNITAKYFEFPHDRCGLQD